MNHSRRRPMAAMLAVCAVLALSVTAFASGGRVLEHVFKMMTADTISQGIGEDGDYCFDSEGGEPVSPVELRDDGRLYLTINGENRDITDECSYETPYVYECTGEDGLIHTFIIGGEPEEIGWVEYACDTVDDTAVSGVVISVKDDVELDTLPWLSKGLEQAMGGVNIILEDVEIDPETNSFEVDSEGVVIINGDAHMEEQSITVTLLDGEE